MQGRISEIFEFMEATEAVMKTSLYKNQNRFRNDKAFKGMRMILKSIDRLRSLRIVDSIRRFNDTLPLASDISETTSTLYLPMKNLLQQVLLLMIAYFEQAQRLIGLCEYTVSYLNARIRLGHFWNWAVFSLANTSRLW